MGQLRNKNQCEADPFQPAAFQADRAALNHFSVRHRPQLSGQPDRAPLAQAYRGQTR